MSQHDNGRRPAGAQAGAWQQGREHPDHASGAQHDQAAGGRYGSPYGSGQRDQYHPGRSQQGDDWRERQGPAAGGWRPAMVERDRSWNERGGQGSFGGQATDNDHGDHGGRRRRGYDQGYDARGDFSGVDGNDVGNGSQESWQQGRQSQSYHDPDYRQWRSEQMAKLDRDYDEWRRHRYQRFSREFDEWRASRADNPATRSSSDVGTGAASSPGSASPTAQQEHAGDDKDTGKTASR